MNRYPALSGSLGHLSNMTARATLVLSALALSATIVRAETWTIVEGDKGAIRGVWQVTIDGRTISGSAAMLTPKGQALSYRIAGEMRDGKFVVHRVEPSDRTPCTYVVEVGRSDRMAGSALCDGSSHPWHVTRTGKR
jgi:hypothetical protein